MTTDYQVQTPVVFIVFRRPDVTAQVFERIAAAKPKTLFIIADGPRTDAEAAQVAQVREIVARIDWDCDVRRNYADQNLGLRKRISSGMNWVFDQVEEAIILEDDCLPAPTFFRYCDELLAYHRDNPQVMHISGDNFGHTRPADVRDSYYFSRYAHVWGWATWRRAWNRYDVDITAWRSPAEQRRVLGKFPNPLERRFWKRILDRVAYEQYNTWDYSWLFACFQHDGLCAMPFENQIQNVGVTAGGTSTQDTTSEFANRPLREIAFPLQHPAQLKHSAAGDRRTSTMLIMDKTRSGRAVRKLRRILHL